MANDIISRRIKSAINIASMAYRSVSAKENVNLDSVEAQVQALSREISVLDLASQEGVKGELKTLDSVLEKLEVSLSYLQHDLTRKISELSMHKRTFNAYAHVVNRNTTANTHA